MAERLAALKVAMKVVQLENSTAVQSREEGREEKEKLHFQTGLESGMF